ncbi:TSUP family transporter [Pseudoteredinibacter isoporae]|uniref:TSUP family transporter n=1 Tax=Pseudoteredinibacter isoporae TaxID=570281 RepID=UPI003340D13F
MDIAGFSIEILLLLFAVSVVAGVLDTLAGGGGLLSLPALLMSGLPPLAALGTNKLQGCMGTATATYMMLKHKHLRWKDARHLMLYVFVGAVLGTLLVQFINVSVLSFVIPIVLLFIGVYFLLSPRLLRRYSSFRLSIPLYEKCLVPLIACYDGMFGPGTGSFFTLAGTAKGDDLIPSTAMAKALNFSTNIASLMVFVFAGHVIWLLGIVMMIGQVFGAYLGARSLVKINPEYLRLLIVLMCFGMLLKYIVY